MMSHADNASATSRQAPATTPYTPQGGGKMGAQVRAFDWAGTPLGPIGGWTPSLQTTVQLTLACGFPMIVLWGPQLVQIYNDGYHDLMGENHPNGLGQPIRDCWPEVWHINEPAYGRVWLGETVTHKDALFPIWRHGALEQAFFTLCYSPIREASGAVAGVLVTVCETTQSLQMAAMREAALSHAETARRKSEERYVSLFNSLDTGFCIIEILFDSTNKPCDYRFLEINPAFEQQTDIRNAIGRRMLEFAPQHEQHWFDIYGRVARTGEPIRYENRAEELHRYYDVYAFRIGPPEDHTVAVLFNDISSRKIAEDALAERERRLSVLLHMSDTMRALPEEADVVRAACRVIQNELGVGRCLYGFVYAEHDQVQIVADVGQPGMPNTEGTWPLSRFGPDLIALHTLGQPVVIEDTAVHATTAAVQHTTFDPIHTRSLIGIPLMRDGRFVAFLAIHNQQPRHYTTGEVAIVRDAAVRLWDAVERARARMALRESEARLQTLYVQEQAARAHAEEASRLKDQFLATVSHELRTPMTAILGYSQLLLSRKRDEAYIARTVEKMNRSAQTQAQLIDDLLDISRIVSGKLHVDLQPLKVHTVVHAALDTVRPALEAKGLHIHIQLRDDALVLGDANRLQQIIWNVLTNAIKFTPPDGTLALALTRQDSMVELAVRDTGQGISAEFLPFMFDHFRQADGSSNRAHGGLGLGLAIVQHLVEAHGGTVRASSDGVGQGTTVTIRLPLFHQDSANTAPQHATSVATAYPPELRGLRVLLVDDQADILEILYDMLAPCGAIIQASVDVREALQIIQTWQPHVLVSDIAMPGEDGYWLIREVRALPPSSGGAVIAVAASAYARAEDRRQALAAGFQAYVIKPIEPNTFRQTLAQLVSAAAGVAGSDITDHP